MIYTLCIKCVSGPYLEKPFERTIEAPDDMTLGDLHDEIQNLTGFNNDHFAAFFVARNPWGKRIQVIEPDESGRHNRRLYRIPLKKSFPLPPGIKLFYLFDFGDEWVFQIGKRGKPKVEKDGVKYPRVTKEVGPKPVQYPDSE